MKSIKNFASAWVDPKFVPTALKVAMVVGSILFTINHGSAVIKGNITKNRIFSGLLTYLVPYSVSIHGQSLNRRQNNNLSS